jgi:hypothetical protein
VQQANQLRCCRPCSLLEQQLMRVTQLNCRWVRRAMQLRDLLEEANLGTAAQQHVERLLLELLPESPLGLATRQNW